jgi:hypothetical protein
MYDTCMTDQRHNLIYPKNSLSQQQLSVLQFQLQTSFRAHMQELRTSTLAQNSHEHP